MEEKGRKKRRVSREFFVFPPWLAWELIAKPWLALADRSRLARVNSELYKRFMSKDENLFFMSSLWRVPYMSLADRIRSVKRSGLIDCLRWAWDRESGAVVTNQSLMGNWLCHVIASDNLGVLRWALSKVHYEDDEWPILVARVTESMLTTAMEEHAFSVALNLDAWWQPAQYDAAMRNTECALMIAIRFMHCKRYDLLEILLGAPHWPEPLNESNRFAIAIISAVRTEDFSLFTAWWNSPQCAAMQLAIPSRGPTPRDYLRFTLGMMMQSPNANNVLAVQVMAEDLRRYL